MTARTFSLASKLATLDVGQSVWFEDEAPLTGPTNMERQITSIACRSKKLTGRKVCTTRADAITVGRRHAHLLRVERVG